MKSQTQIAELVRKNLIDASNTYLEEIVSHGIHNLTNDYHGDSDEEYELYNVEFDEQAGQLLNRANV